MVSLNSLTLEADQKRFEDCLLGISANAAQLREIYEKGLADLRESVRSSTAQLAECQQDLRTARQQLFERDTTVSYLEAELSSFKKENDDLRELSRARSDQVHHMLAQLEAQNAFYADVITKDREIAEKTNTQLYHTVMQLLTLVPNLPLASEDELVLKFARCLPDGEANAKNVDSVWERCENTLFPLIWDEHYKPLYGAPEQFFASHPETFFRRADGALYLLKPVPSAKPIPPPCDIKAVAPQQLANGPTTVGPDPVEVSAGDSAEGPSIQPGQQDDSPVAETDCPASSEDESSGPPLDAPADVSAPPSQARQQTKSLETWFPKLDRQHRDKVPPLPQGALTERITQQAKRHRGARETGDVPQPAPVQAGSSMAACMRHPAPTQADGRVMLAATQQEQRNPAQGNAAVPLAPQAVDGTRASSHKGLQNGRRNGSRGLRDQQQPPRKGPSSVPSVGPKQGGGGSMPIASNAPPSGPVLPSMSVASTAPPSGPVLPQTVPAAHVVAASQLPPQASGPQVSPAPAPAQQYVVVTPIAPPRESRAPVPRVLPAKVAVGWANPRKDVGGISGSAKEGPAASPGTSGANGASAKSVLATNPAVAEKVVPDGAIGNAVCGSNHSLSTLDSASVTSSAMSAQAVAAPPDTVPGGEGGLSKASLSKSALKRMKKKAAKAT